VKQFVCGELVPGCEHVFHGGSEEEILDQVVVHAREDHGMPEVPPEVEDRIRASITEPGG
jgi:predicted small metal-binding protein